MRRVIIAAVIAWAGVCTASASPAAAQEKALAENNVCAVLAKAATDNELPVEFFTRLIWQESRFNPNAVSHKGALGIAQFMPATAAQRGLSNPLDPITALRESASFLRELRITFGGNLGLAAAAYNAGPGRVEGWIAKRRTLPQETQAYVRIITGHSAEAWAGPNPPAWQDNAKPGEWSCAELAKLVKSAPMFATATPMRQSPAWGPWGVQLAGNWSEGKVLASYEQLRRQYGAVLGERLPLVLSARSPGRRGAAKHIVRVSEQSREKAQQLCTRLRSAGGACIVLKNPAS